MSNFSAYSAYYDILYRDKNYVQESSYILEKLKTHSQKKVSSVLELGCGTGKHAEHFLRAGLEVTGVDLSATMIEQARRKLEGGGNAAFLEGDVRTVRTGAMYDSVVSLFHVASYQTSNQDIADFLTTAYRHLNDGGVFLFDFWYGPAVYAQKPSVRVKRMEDEHFSVLRTAEPQHRVNDCVVEVHYEVMVEEKNNNRVSRIHEVHPMRYFFLPELQVYLQSAGFNIDTLLFEEWMTKNTPSENTWGVTAVVGKG